MEKLNADAYLRLTKNSSIPVFFKNQYELKKIVLC